MDEELTLHELKRFEAERKPLSIPAEILDTAWVREAQIEAVIDAVLAVTYSGKPAAYAHPRRVGQCCARIAANLRGGPNPVLARRVGVLSEVDPTTLDAIPEPRSFSTYVADHQRASIGKLEFSSLSVIVTIARAFDRCIGALSTGRGAASAMLFGMRHESTDKTFPIFGALERALSPTKRNAAWCGHE